MFLRRKQLIDDIDSNICEMHSLKQSISLHPLEVMNAVQSGISPQQCFILAAHSKLPSLPIPAKHSLFSDTKQNILCSSKQSNYTSLGSF
jgi:C1A family cysteine protease